MSLPRLAAATAAATAILVGGAGVAAADPAVPSCPEITPMPAATLRDLRVALTPETAALPVGMEATAGSVFPAISKDGQTIVQLFRDEEDFSSAPVETVVFFNADGVRRASFKVGGHGPEAAPPAKIVARVNAALAKTTWRALPLARSCALPGNPDDDLHTTVAFADGHAFTFDERTGHLTSEDTAHGPRRVRSQALAVGPIGWRESFDPKDKTQHGCGTVRSITEAIWSPTTGILLVVATGQLGGDSCVGRISAETVAAVKVQ